jgi:hypothetical protein
MEVGYWLWDAAAGRVTRSFALPRGSTILAGGPAAAGDRRLVLTAESGSETEGILSNAYLADAARTCRYRCTVTMEDDTYSYEQAAVIEHAIYGGTMEHTDRNVLRRVE